MDSNLEVMDFSRATSSGLILRLYPLLLLKDREGCSYLMGGVKVEGGGDGVAVAAAFALPEALDAEGTCFAEGTGPAEEGKTQSIPKVTQR